MKKYLILLFAALALNVNAQQEQQGRGPKREGAKRGMVHMGKDKDAKANLWKSVKEEDKEAFKALMKEYHGERKAVMEKNKGQKLEKGQKPTEEQMNTFIKQSYAKRKALLDLEEKYYGKFRKFLAPWQAAQAVKVEATGKKSPTSAMDRKVAKDRWGVRDIWAARIVMPGSARMLRSVIKSAVSNHLFVDNKNP